MRPCPCPGGGWRSYSTCLLAGCCPCCAAQLAGMSLAAYVYLFTPWLVPGLRRLRSAAPVHRQLSFPAVRAVMEQRTPYRLRLRSQLPRPRPTAGLLAAMEIGSETRRHTTILVLQSSLASFLVQLPPHAGRCWHSILLAVSEYKFLEYQQFHSVENTKKQKEM